MAPPPGCRQNRRDTPGPADRAGGIGYFLIWTLFGLAAFPLGIGMAAAEMQNPHWRAAVLIEIGLVVLIASALQFSAHKAHHLARCREPPRDSCTLPAHAGAAWRHGLRYGPPL